ncbi:MAG: pyridoxal phosphate-dependent aminotransferase [Candidatus Omnitrophica bacterium]|nr:pyridoxal phosphate-dependent aminotransferase [Candidatus Omnitrophota bacterium]
MLKVNSRIKEVLGSTTLAITARAKELKDQGADVVNFAAGEPDFDTPDYIKEAAVKAINGGFTKYTPSSGAEDLRVAICEKFKRDNKLDYKPNQIVVGCGAKHSIFNAVMVLCDAGEEVLIPAPYWVSYPEMVKIAGAKPVFIQTTKDAGFKITPQQLQAAINPRTKILILNSPSNPTGKIYSKKELEAIAEICVKHHVYVISDEIYEKLLYVDEPFVSIASLGKDIFDQTITVNGVSKAYAMTGWRIGYAAGPSEVMGYMKNLQDHSTSNPTSISQKATIAALKGSEAGITAMRDEFKARRDLMMSLVDKVPGVTYIKPDGAFYLFCDFSKFGLCADIAKRILNDVNVALIPGDGFGAEGWIRLTFSTSQERITEGITRIKAWIEKNGR